LRPKFFIGVSVEVAKWRVRGTGTDRHEQTEVKPKHRFLGDAHVQF